MNSIFSKAVCLVIGINLLIVSFGVALVALEGTIFAWYSNSGHGVFALLANPIPDPVSHTDVRSVYTIPAYPQLAGTSMIMATGVIIIVASVTTLTYALYLTNRIRKVRNSRRPSSLHLPLLLRPPSNIEPLPQNIHTKHSSRTTVFKLLQTLLGFALLLTVITTCVAWAEYYHTRTITFTSTDTGFGLMYTKPITPEAWGCHAAPFFIPSDNLPPLTAQCHAARASRYMLFPVLMFQILALWSLRLYKNDVSAWVRLDGVRDVTESTRRVYGKGEVAELDVRVRDEGESAGLDAVATKAF